MASPLSWLRKHQKVLLVVFGVTLMVLFLVGSFLPDMRMGGSSQMENPVAVTWKGGQMTRMDLDILRFRHYQAINLQNALRERAFQQRGENYREAFIPIEEVGNRQSNVDRSFLDEELFRRYLLAQLAAEQGITISDAYLDNFLTQAAGGISISRSELESINRTVNRGEIGINAVRRHLKLELAAQLMMHMSSSALDFSMSPVETAQRFAQTNRRIDCEIIPVKVSDYLAKVTDQPSESELRQLFAQGQHDTPDPDGKKPGFKLPRRFGLQLFTANYETFLTNEINKLTEKEVQEEYERRVQANDALVYEDLFGSMPDLQLPGLDSDPGKLPGESNETDKDPIKDNQQSENQAGESDQSGDESKQIEGQQGDGQEGDGFSTQVFTSLPQDEGKEQANETNQDEVTEQEGEGADAGQSDPSDQAPPNQDNTPRRRVRPLVEVAERLKRDMAAKDAQAALESAIVEAESELRMHDALVRDWESQGRRGLKPELPDFRELADRLRLQFQETEVIDLVTLRDSDLAKSLEGLAFDVAVHFNEASLYHPYRFTSSFPASTALYWFKEKHEAKERTFAEAKGDVLDFWRKRQAMDMAMKRAAAIAQQAVAEDKSFYEIDPALARSTGEFSFYERDVNVFMQIAWKIGSPMYVENPGEEFMEAAFGLQPKQTAAAFNADRTIAYAIRMIADASQERGNLTDMLYMQMVNGQDVPRDLMMISRDKRIDTFRTWARQIMDAKEVRWLDR